MSEIVRVRVVHVRQRGQIDLEHVLIVPIGEVAQRAVIPMAQRIDDLLGFGFGLGLFCSATRGVLTFSRFRLLFGVHLGELFLQIFKPHAVVPESFGFGEIFRIGQIMAVDRNPLV